MSYEQRAEFDGHDLTKYMIVTDVTRQILAKRRIAQTQVPGRDGVLVSSVGLEPLEITVKGGITRRLREEVAEARRELSTALRSKRPARLVLPDDPETFLMAIYEGGAQPSRLSHVPDVELTFLCPDPVAHGRRRAVVVSGESKVNAGGNHPSRPRVTVKPPAGAEWSITNVDTGEFVRVRASFDGSQTVVVDMDDERCTINGADAAVDVSSDFFPLDGATTLRVSGGEAELEWDERWM